MPITECGEAEKRRKKKKTGGIIALVAKEKGCFCWYAQSVQKKKGKKTCI